VLLLAFLAAACSGASTPPPKTPAEPEDEPAEPAELAPELDGGAAWLNTDRPLSLSMFRGHVVVLDFWTYCCINCLHVLPELERVERQFADEPFQVIGVHSGKFDAEKDAARIRSAMARHGVHHPVVVDSSFAIWKRFGVKAWPTLVIIGPEGELLARVSGEPPRGELAKLVRSLLDESRAMGKLASEKIEITPPETLSTGPLAFPGKVAVAPNGDVAIADSSHHRIVIANATGEVKDVAGSGIAGSADGGFDTAAFNYPQGMVFTGGVLFVADTENHQIRALDLDARTVSTVAGTGLKGGARKGGPALERALRSPWALAKDGDRLYVAMAGSHQIWVLDLVAGVIEPLAGSGAENIDDGAFAEATFSQPSGLALVGDVLYVADSEVSAVRAVDLKKKRVRTLVGTGLFDFGDVDGVGGEAKLQHALGIVQRGDVLFVADTFNNKLKRLDPSTRRVTTVADGLSEPGGLALMADGRVLVADTNNHRLVTFDPASGALAPFVIAGLAPPKARGLVLAHPSSGTTDVPTLAVEASGKLSPGQATLVIEPRAPAGAKLTDGAPVVAEIDASKSQGLSFPTKRLRTRVQNGKGTLRLPLVAKEAGARLLVDVSFFWCTTGDEEACYPANARLDVKLDVGEGSGNDQARVVFQATR
jgi:sugar lactone lactonase YvrE